MVAHLHSEITPGCYRCELGKDEMEGVLNDLRQNISNDIWKADADKLYIIEAVLDL